MKYFRSPHLLPIEIQDGIEYVSAATVLEAEQLGADLIDISYSDYLASSELSSISNLESYYLGAADCILKLDNKYHFYQLSQKSFLYYLSQLKMNLKSNHGAVIVGNELTISQFLPALTKLGYDQFIFVVENTAKVKEFVDNIQKTFLGLKVQFFNFQQVSLIDYVSSLLLVDFDHDKYPELVESLTYFNFLSAGSVFFDVGASLGRAPVAAADNNSKSELVKEAERAQMLVVDSAQYHQIRFQLADQILTKKIK